MISVVLPIYNGEAYLEECLKSILNQTERDFELVISDDNSTDKSKQIIQSFSDERIKYIINSGERGIFQNLNNAIIHSKGDFIQIFNQDDVMMREMLSEQFLKIKQYPFAGMIYCQKINIDSKGVDFIPARKSVVDEYHSITPELIKSSVAYQYFASFGCLPGNLSTVMLSRKAFDISGTFNSDFSYAGDFEYWFRLSNNFDIVFLKKKLCSVRTHEKRASNVLSSKDLLQTSEMFKIGNGLIDKYDKEHLDEAIKYVRSTIGVYRLHQLIGFVLKRKWKTALAGIKNYKGYFKVSSLIVPYVKYILLKAVPTKYPIY